MKQFQRYVCYSSLYRELKRAGKAIAKAKIPALTTAPSTGAPYSTKSLLAEVPMMDNGTLCYPFEVSRDVTLTPPSVTALLTS